MSTTVDTKIIWGNPNLSNKIIKDRVDEYILCFLVIWNDDAKNQ